VSFNGHITWIVSVYWVPIFASVQEPIPTGDGCSPIASGLSPIHFYQVGVAYANSVGDQAV
jgi:hypothetical protein